MLKIFIVFVLFTYGYVLADEPCVTLDVTTPSEVFNEEPCLSSGGICVIADECPTNFLSRMRGLCPRQQQSGVECCYALSKLERKCSRRGGQCLSRNIKCPENLIIEVASDCADNENCCALVQ